MIVPVVGQQAQITLNTSNAGTIPANSVRARVTGPSGKTQDATVTSISEGYHVRFNVTESGIYSIEPEVLGLPIKCVQMKAVEPVDPGKVRAYGPGLSQGTVNKPADFMIDTRGAGDGQLSVTLEGPSEANIQYQDNKDATCRVTYHTTGSINRMRFFRHKFICCRSITVPGNYNINILYDGKHISGSPFRATIRSDVDTRSIRCYGPGLDTNGVYFSISLTLLDFL